MRYLRSSLCLFLLLVLFTGLAYPLLTTVLAQWLFPAQANGSLIYRDNAVVGSSLIGQPFSQAGYFQGRPSATSDAPYNALASGGSNLAASNPALDKQLSERATYWHQTIGNQQPIPTELLTASGSGLDPQISPEAARYQALYIAQARGMSLQQIQQLIDHFTESSKPAFIGQPTVNVLLLNLALDEEKPLP
ncbi:potassium-transporting ATPase subunit KdpC [Pectobacterium wasabiae]|uniref:Potassium-transporting ATPase KdpC subunit n=1 Tax=Pectobacterium wasabiae TaxID=55208 RepID=A0AAW3EJD2_9GAMM|nr:potassium-transporting ATPase subunit KdpC [Pectobacterium wasabiae]AOR64566.1 K+-transporting ATPase subunit C [Pectobacterium wasabiae CFBP 3304]EJS93324.1 Potassium-transporting ATPase, C subunit [Pectobacterium wasabiae CFBP 3304]KFX08941.1 potassium-transporting ATPase subunit C [Pectobacterium wasabiae]KGA29048.1 potassium-transporting ATPase subunit C [Pectobacterium wasabiae]